MFFLALSTQKFFKFFMSCKFVNPRCLALSEADLPINCPKEFEFVWIFEFVDSTKQSVPVAC